MSRLATKGKGSVQIAPAVTKAIAYIDKNYMKQPGLESISKAAGVSSQHLCRLFRQTLNCRPMEYITKRKIQAAKMLLAETQKTVEQIAEETGFCDSSYFARFLKGSRVLPRRSSEMQNRFYEIRKLTAGIV